MSASQPALVLTLHGHLPWVNHPEYDHFLEEDWFFEGVADCYLPILEMADGWARDGVVASFTMDLSPPLLSMMTEPLLRERCARYLDGRRTLIRRYLSGLAHDSEFRAAALFANEEAERRAEQYAGLGRDLPAAFRRHWDEGRIEVITCGVTHGLLPVLLDEGSARAQVLEAVKTHERILGRRPRGIWMPECGITPSNFDYFAEAGLLFTFAEDRAILYGAPPPAYGVMRPVWTPEGIAVFARDPVSGREVWSADEGYPGDFRYREFYRDLGYDAPEALLDEHHKQGTGDRKNVGLKLPRITGRVSLDQKRPYSPADAAAAIEAHAHHFVQMRIAQTKRARDEHGVWPCLTAAFDAELFGHWWFEGPRFLDGVVRRLVAHAATEPAAPRPMSAYHYLEGEPRHQLMEPAVSSWGDGGAFSVWVNGENDWLWRLVHDCRERLGQQVRRQQGQGASSLEERALKQATREMLLAQSSDWPFILTMGTQMGYARERPIKHLSRAHRLLHALETGRIDEADLHQLELRDGVFPTVDPSPFAALT
ncbi:MAG: glycoside hydrolase family 57 protein [Myxococcota bacterium]